MPQNLTNDKSILVQVMAWCRQATSHNWADVDADLCRHIASLGHGEFSQTAGLISICWVSVDVHANYSIHHMRTVSANKRRRYAWNGLSHSSRLKTIKRKQTPKQPRGMPKYIASPTRINSVSPGRFELNLQAKSLMIDGWGIISCEIAIRWMSLDRW